MDENKDNNIIVEDKKITAEPTVPNELEKQTRETVEGHKPIVMNTTATLDPITGKWKGYVPQKGITPPWNPFDPSKRKSRVTIKERKFMMMLSTTGSMQESYRGVYKVKDYGNSKLESVRVSALANQVLRRIRAKDPQLVEAMTFEDIDKDFVKKGMLKLYNKTDLADHDKIRLLELMGKTQAMFTDKIQSETRVTEVIKTVYKESDEDFPEQDHRLGRLEMEELNKGGMA